MDLVSAHGAGHEATEPNGERRPCPFARAGGREAAPVVLDDGSRDGQAEPAA